MLEPDGVQLEAPVEPVLELGHLSGWGRGMSNGTSVFMPWTRGNPHERTVTLVVSGKGVLRARAGSSRAGWQTLAATIA